MKYNFIEIGNLIRTLRKQSKRNQDEFIEALNEQGVSIGRNRLSGIENGNSEDFSLDFLLATCKIFNCDIGYLLGEYKERFSGNHELCLATGLSEETLIKLRGESKFRMDLFNQIVIDEKFWAIIDTFSKAITNRNFLEPNGDYIATAFLSKYNNENIPKIYRDALLVVGGSGFAPAYKQKICEDATALFNKITNSAENQ